MLKESVIAWLLSITVGNSCTKWVQNPNYRCLGEHAVVQLVCRAGTVHLSITDWLSLEVVLCLYGILVWSDRVVFLLVWLKNRWSELGLRFDLRCLVVPQNLCSSGYRWFLISALFWPLMHEWWCKVSVCLVPWFIMDESYWHFGSIEAMPFSTGVVCCTVLWSWLISIKANIFHVLHFFLFREVCMYICH